MTSARVNPSARSVFLNESQLVGSCKEIGIGTALGGNDRDRG
jgi:hypothetical protein